MSANKTIIVGKSSPMSLKAKQQSPKPKTEFKKYFEVFLSRIDADASDESIIEHLNKMNLNFYDFKRLNTQSKHYLSFYFKVDYSQKDRVLELNNWPDRVLVREFVRSYSKF